MSKKLISIVIPAYNEAQNITLFYNELIKILSTIKTRYDYEIIFVNDGSSDNSWGEIKKLGNKDKSVKGVNFSRNFGKEIALTVGIENSVGDAVITMDGDGQHPVEKIPEFIKYWEEGYDIVYNKRPDTIGASFTKKISSKLFYSIFNSISEFKLEAGSTDYRLLDRQVVIEYLKFSEKNRLYRGLTDWLGFEKKALVFDANESFDNRKTGSYSYKKLFNLALDSITSFSLFPLKLVGYLGIIIIFISSILFILIIIDKFIYTFLHFSNLAIVVVLNTILIGIVMSSLGLLALYIGKIHEEVLGRPMYIVSKKVNFEKERKVY